MAGSSLYDALAEGVALNDESGLRATGPESGTHDGKASIAAPVGAAQAEVLLPSRDLHAELAFFRERLGFRLESIFPADDPAQAVLSGHGLRVRLERGAACAPGVVRLHCAHPDAVGGGARELRAPNGTRIELRDIDAQPPRPPTRHALVVERQGADGGSWVVGRAGMHYRDLIPGRLGGAVIASHIRIPEAGPVPDDVHYHIAAFQLIYCYRGWVDLVYEDQGPPFRLAAGDCVIQPPRIRHRVLESSGNLEVVELAVPAEHLTALDHALELPTGPREPERDFAGQRFCRHRRRDAQWRAGRVPGFEACDTGIAAATGGIANVQVARRRDGALRPRDEPRRGHPLHLRPRRRHDAAHAGGRGPELARGRRLRAAPGAAHRLRGLHRRSRAAGSLAARRLRDHRPPEPLMPPASARNILRYRGKYPNSLFYRYFHIPQSPPPSVSRT